LSFYSQEELEAIAEEINNLPRKGLGVLLPLSVVNYFETAINIPLSASEIKCVELLSRIRILLIWRLKRP
jgi:hypothetical protein